MLVNMLSVKSRKITMCSFGINGIFASFGAAKAFTGIFASEFTLCSPASVSVITP